VSGGRAMRAEIARRYLSVHPEEAAALLEQRSLDEVAGVLETCSPDVAGGVLRRMRSALASDVLARLPGEHAGAVLCTLSHGDAARLLRGIAPEVRQELIGRLPREPRQALGALLRFPEGTAGALMDPRVASLPGDLTAEQAAARLRAEPAYGAYYLYVVDREQRLVGVLNYRDLVRAEPSSELASCMRPAVQSIRADASGQALVGHPGWRGFLALPVVDEQGVLLGALRYESVAPHEAAASAVGAGEAGAAAPGGRVRRLLRRLRRRVAEDQGGEP
jgi:magnesium transporter